MGQIVTILLVVAGVGSGLYYFSRWQRESDFRPLYTALAPDDAGAVVQRLKESNVLYRLSEDGRTVLAPSAQIAELRLSLASAGLPRNGRIGYELFDKTNFGATEFTEQINYRRALEGELERSVVCLSEVEQARVHLSFPKESVFLEARQPAKASVMVKLRLGSRLTPQNVAAITQLVASAVQSLAPEAVSVLDMQGNLLNRPRRELASDGDPPSEAMLEFRQAMERDLVAKINATLEPVVGTERFRASAALECDFTSGDESEESFDPAKSVMLSSQKTEEGTATSAPAGVPGTASNLPRPTSQPTTTAGGISRQTENITYQSSRIVRRKKLPQGTVKRMSVAVLLASQVKRTGSGATAQAVAEPPSPERLKVIRDLVAAAIGLNTERGDQLTVESLPFESTLEIEPLGTPAAPPAAPRPSLPPWLEKIGGQKTLVGAGIGAAALLLLTVVMALFRAGRSRGQVTVESAPALAAGGAGEAAAREHRASEIAAPSYPELPAGPPKKSAIVAGRLKEAIKKDPTASAQIMRSWLTEDED